MAHPYYPTLTPFGRAGFTPTTVVFFSVGMMLLLQQLVLPLLGFGIIGLLTDEPVRDMAIGEATVTPTGAAYLKSYLSISHLLTFGLLAWVLARAGGPVAPTLGLSQRPQLWRILGGAAVLAVGLPALQLTAISPDALSLPAGLEDLEAALREVEHKSRLILMQLLRDDLATNLVVVAVLPAVLEEFFFRGLLQNTLRRMLSVHAAIWLTAIIFSFIHFQFLGFFYRMLLGGLFGYFYLWSGSIWPAVAGHLLNNTLGVLAIYGVHHWGWDPALAADEVGVPNWAALASVVLLAAGLFFYHKYRLAPPADEPRTA